jgi:uncharacterized membrane protein
MNRYNTAAEVDSRSFTPAARKWLRLLHVLFSLSWLGGVLSLGILIFFIPQPDTASALVFQHVIFHRMDHFLVAPAAVSSLLTGLLLCAKTNWGFFSYWWLIVKLIATVSVIVFCTLVLVPIDQELIDLSRAFGLAAMQNQIYLGKKMLGMIVNPVNVSLLIYLVYLSFFKPWGRR